ncbi:MAG: hypothetical protein QOI34_1876 [Verrucomicrobiota bacterium]|jgi:hypothetical protein
MKTRPFVLLVLSLLLLITPMDPAFGARKKAKATPPEKHETLISSVTPTAITVAQDKVAKTFTITQFTEIIVNGQKATAADLKPGMTVTVTMGTDPTRASRIVASAKK